MHFFFPTHEISIEAESLEEAQDQLQALSNIDPLCDSSTPSKSSTSSQEKKGTTKSQK